VTPRFLACSLTIIVASLAHSCTTPKLPSETNDSLVKITDTSHPATLTVMANKATSGLADYQHGGKSFKAQWLSCERTGGKGIVVLNHRDEAGFDDKKFCSGWIAQAILQGGFDVVAVNRPGFAGSTGRSDFAGPRSIAAIEAGVKAAIAANPRTVVGVMGYSSGAIAAAFYARKVPGIAWMMLGGGIYDLEAVAKETQSEYIRKEVAAIKKAEGDLAWENRSIAYDVSGLPKRIVLYHGKNDTAVPSAQAQSFRDSLASSEYHVNLDVIDGVAHSIEWAHHRQIIQVLMKSLEIAPPHK